MKPEMSLNPIILVIDTDEDDCFFFREAIAEISARITIVTSRSTDQLWKILEKTNPALIFIEYKLSRINGIEWVKRIKSHPVFQSIPVVMWSTTRMLPVISAAFKAGVQNYLEKPCELKKWIEKIREVLQQNQFELPVLSVCQENFC